MANKFTVFVLGGLAGALGALLLAPRRGAETRQMVAEKAGDVFNGAQQWGNEAGAQAQEAFKQATEKGQEVVDAISAKTHEVAQAAATGAQSAVDAAQAKVQEAAAVVRPAFT